MDTTPKREAWNKGKLIGQKPPLKPDDLFFCLAIQIVLLRPTANCSRRLCDIGKFC